MSEKKHASKLLLCCAAIVLMAVGVFAESHGKAEQASTLTTIGNFGYWAPCTGPDNCTYFFNPGSRASGSGNFSTGVTGAPSVSYSFVTSLPLTWSQNGNSYSATFGLGGTFEMSLPNGSIFMGTITSGAAGYEGTTSSIQVYYAGRWNDGQFATGSVYEYQINGNPPDESLTEQVSP
jgi:hypothetical protein